MTRIDKNLPFVFIYGIMQKAHLEVVRAQRWDLTPITRPLQLICLN